MILIIFKVACFFVGIYEGNYEKLKEDVSEYIVVFLLAILLWYVQLKIVRDVNAELVKTLNENLKQKS